jgi:hypothetical protein
MNLDFLVLLLSYKASSRHYKIYKKKKKIIIHSHSSTWDVGAIKTQAVVLRVFSPFMVLDLRCKALKF